MSSTPFALPVVGVGRRAAPHEVSPLRLAVGVLEEIRARNELDTARVDDVILGVADPVNEQGADIARTAVLVAGYDQLTPGVQINRFCASGLEACNMAAAQVMAGQSDIAIGGGVESISRIEMFSSGGVLVSDAHFTLPNYFVPQRIAGRSSDAAELMRRHISLVVKASCGEGERRASVKSAERRKRI